MFVRSTALTLAIPFISSYVNGLDLDVNNQDSIKSAAKTLAGGIIAKYNADLKTEDGVPGLFNDPYFWWEAGTVWDSIISYSYLTGDTQHDAAMSEALLFQKSSTDNFMPPNQTKVLGNDDQSCWGLAAMTAAEVGLQQPKDTRWIDLAVNVWESQASRLDIQHQNGTCGGGLNWQIFRFNLGYNYKNTWSNGNFFLLSARLAKFTGNATYSQYADKSFKWAKDIGLISDSFAVFDGTDDKTNCTKINRIQWSAQHGIYTEGAALMYNLTNSQVWSDAVKGLVEKSSIFQKNDAPGILYEVACERTDKCDYDQKAFKGIMARTFARAAIAAPIVKDTINTVLTKSAQAAAKACTGTGDNLKCHFSWQGSNNEEKRSLSGNDLGEMYNALNFVQGLLYSKAKPLGTSSSAGSSNATGSGRPTGTGVQGPQNTGAAGSIAINFVSVLAVFFAVASTF